MSMIGGKCGDTTALKKQLQEKKRKLGVSESDSINTRGGDSGKSKNSPKGNEGREISRKEAKGRYKLPNERTRDKTAVD